MTLSTRQPTVGDIKKSQHDTIIRSRQLNLMTDPNFRFVIEELPRVVLFSQTFTLPGIRVNPAVVDNPFVAMKLQGDMAEFDDLTFSFLVDENMNNYYEVYSWLMAMSFPRKFQQYQKMAALKTPFPEYGRSDISVAMLTNKTNYVESVKFVQCHPISLGDISLTHANAGVEHPTCQITFTYDYFILEHQDDTDEV